MTAAKSTKKASGRTLQPVKTVNSAADKRVFIPVRASYDAASRSPESTRHWRGADMLSADAALAPDVRKLIISRARYEAANNGYVSGILNTIADDAIGTGARLQLSISETETQEWGEDVEAALARREKRWRQWCKTIGLGQKLTIARRTKAQDGEVFLCKVYNPKVRNAAKLDIVLYESEQVGSSLLAINPEYHSTGVPKEIDGILYDEYGNERAYRFWKLHPGAMGTLVNAEQDSQIVDAGAVIHYANIMRPGQHRGIPEIASTLPIFNDLRRFTNAVLSAAETAAEISFVLSTDKPAVDENGDSNPVQLDPGAIVEFCRNSGVALPEGWKATQFQAEQPTSNHAEFVRTKIREASRSLSMPLNVALGDSSGYNYASGRLDHQVYFRVIRKERTLIEDKILDNLLEAWEEWDKIYNPADYPAGIEIEHEWMWDGFAHVDPAKEAGAQQVRLASKTTTLAEECGADGKDWLRIIRQRMREEKAEMDLRRKYGLPEAPSQANQPQQNWGEEEE